MPSTDDRSRERRRSRSRSPHRSVRNVLRRSRSPRFPRRRRYDGEGPSETSDTRLPFDARPISKHDLPRFRPMFGLYLDIQKQLVLEELTGHEVRGRWKSFVSKWNRGELAEGWYDPQTLEKARSSHASERRPRSHNPRSSPSYGNEDSGGDEYGPALPSSALADTSLHRDLGRHGPSYPNMQDLQEKREVAAEDAAEVQRMGIDSLRQERRLDRQIQKERLDEIAPRAEVGTRERQLEKKREKAESNRAFAASAHDNADVEIKDSDLMGDGGGLDKLKRMKQMEERKRSEREMRREENLAARRAEREERVQAMREKEEKTMSMLKELAKARFGGAT